MLFAFIGFVSIFSSDPPTENEAPDTKVAQPIVQPQAEPVPVAATPPVKEQAPQADMETETETSGIIIAPAVNVEELSCPEPVSVKLEYNIRSARSPTTRRRRRNLRPGRWHVCKRGDRFAALQPISMGLAGLYGSTAAGAARGLALRMDHGSQYLSDHFTNQIKFWGIQPSYAFVAEPQTNGVAERFNRTLKEQIIHGRIYRNIAELRDAVRDFVELYNAQWIVEKNGYLSPAQARQAWHAAISIRPAA